jgi:hypothetical protein
MVSMPPNIDVLVGARIAQGVSVAFDRPPRLATLPARA